jgi:hypothetical protein
MALLPQIDYGNPLQDAVNLYNAGLKIGDHQREQNALRAIGAILAGGGGAPRMPNALAGAQQGNPAALGDMAAYGNSIGAIESGGEKNPYTALGPVIPKTGDRAYGKYQVMGANIPVWTKEVLGREMTPQEFLSNTEAQEKVFAGKFGEYVKKTGNPQDAASMWFTGKPLAQGANRRDVLGTTGSDYVNKFTQNLGGSPAAAPVRVAQAPAAQPVGGGPDYATAANAAFQSGNVQLGNQLLQMKQAGEDRSLVQSQRKMELALKAQTALANVAYLADTPEKFEAGKAMLAKAGLDVSGYDFSQREALLAQAVDAKTRMELDVKRKTEGTEKYGVTPAYAVDEEGNEVPVQFSSSGKAKTPELPKGMRFRSVEEKKLEGARGTAVGKSQGEAQQTLPAAQRAAETMLSTINRLKTHPGIDLGTGAATYVPNRRGSAAYDFTALNDQAKAKTFMEAREALKGAGQVTDFEGKRGEDAIARLDTAQSKEEYLLALKELESLVSDSLKDLGRKAGVRDRSGGNAGAPQKQRLRFNPATGDFE